jgi:ATP-dependent Zn protease
MTTDNPDGLEATAVHEAGHTVIALLLGLCVGKVTIERKGTYRGMTEIWPSDPAGCRQVWKARGKVRPDHYAIDARVMTLMAGAIAEHSLLGDETGLDGSDIAEVERLIPQRERRGRLEQAT